MKVLEILFWVALFIAGASPAILGAIGAVIRHRRNKRKIEEGNARYASINKRRSAQDYRS